MKLLYYFIINVVLLAYFISCGPYRSPLDGDGNEPTVPKPTGCMASQGTYTDKIIQFANEIYEK